MLDYNCLDQNQTNYGEKFCRSERMKKKVQWETDLWEKRYHQCIILGVLS